MNAPQRIPTLKDTKLFRTRCYINGEWCDAASGKKYGVDNPATEEVIAEVSFGGTADCKRAILPICEPIAERLAPVAQVDRAAVS